MNYQDLSKKILSRSNFAKKDRLIRIILSPHKMILPKIISILNFKIEISAKTFWGEKMSVILPEEVSTAIWRYGYFEEDVCFYLINFLKKNMTFMDIGAHFGFFTLFGSYLVGEQGKVLSIEPTPSTYQQLGKNAIGYKNIKIFNIAAFDKETELEFHDYGLINSAYNSIFEPRKKDKNIPKKTIIIKARKIDDILREEKIQKVDVVKIDAESSEFQVLSGMEKTIAGFRPKIILETGDFRVQEAYNSEKVISFLRDKRYEAYEFAGRKLSKFQKSEPNKYKNLIFIPDENKL